MSTWWVAWLTLSLQSASPERIWLDVTPKDLSATEWVQVEALLRPGLTRRGWALTTRSDPAATLVVQVRRVATGYFVSAASGPAVAGSGVAMSRRIEFARIEAGTLTLVLAQTAEELIAAALEPARPAEPEPAPVVAVERAAPPPVVISAPAAPKDVGPTWAFAAFPSVSFETFQGGVRTVGARVSLLAERERWGLAVRGGAAALLAVSTSAGVVEGGTVWVDVGPSFKLLKLGIFSLRALIASRAHWWSAGGTHAVSGLVGTRAEGWAFVALGELGATIEFTSWLFANAAVAAGYVVRPVSFVLDDTRLLAASGVLGSFTLGLGVTW